MRGAEAQKPMAVATESRPGIDERFEALVLDFLAYMEFERGRYSAGAAYPSLPRMWSET